MESYWKCPKLSGVGTFLKFITIKDFDNNEEIPTVDPENKYLEKFIEKGLQVNAPSQIIKRHAEDKMFNLGIHQLLCSCNATHKTTDEFLPYACQKMSVKDCIEAFDKSKAQSKTNL